MPGMKVTKTIRTRKPKKKKKVGKYGKKIGLDRTEAKPTHMIIRETTVNKKTGKKKSKKPRKVNTTRISQEKFFGDM